MKHQIVRPDIPSCSGGKLIYVKAGFRNTGTVFIGNCSVNSNSGYPLNRGDEIVLENEKELHFHFGNSQDEVRVLCTGG